MFEITKKHEKVRRFILWIVTILATIAWFIWAIGDTTPLINIENAFAQGAVTIVLIFGLAICAIVLMALLVLIFGLTKIVDEESQPQNEGE